MKTFKVLSFVAAAALMLAGCGGPKGDTGPMGPAGAQGPQGNANVIEQTYSVTTPSWVAVGSPAYWYVQLPDSYLTSDIMNYGSAEAFVSYNAGTSWNNIPYSEVVATNVTGIWTVNDAIGTVQVNYTYSDGTLGSDPNTEYSTTCYFKVVTIAGSVMKKHPNTDWHNYNAVESVVNQENGVKLSQKLGK